MVVRVQSFSGVIFLNLNEVEITDTLSTDYEMPRMSAAIWILTA